MSQMSQKLAHGAQIGGSGLQGPTAQDNPCHCFTLRRAARAISRQYGEVMGGLGLKHTQFSLLAILAHAPQHSITSLAEILGLERTSLTRTLRPLESEQLVERTEEGFKRQKAVRITRKGLELYRQGLPLWNTAQRNLTEKLSPKELRQLHALLAKVQAG